MKGLKYFGVLFLAAMMCIQSSVPVDAETTVTKDGITFTVSTEETEYNENEIISATVKVENSNDFAVTIDSIEGIAPKGYVLSVGDNQRLPIGRLAANSSKEVAVKFVPMTEGEIIYTSDLEMFNPFVMTPNKNIIEYIDEPGVSGNKVLRFLRQNEQNFQAVFNGISSDSASVVYEFDLKLLNAAETFFNVRLRDKNLEVSTLCKVTNGGKLFDGSGALLGNVTLKDGEWYNIAVVYNYTERVRSIYLNGTLLKDNIEMGKNFGNADIVSNLLFDFSPLKTILGTDEFDVNEHNAEILLDNIKVYKGTKPCKELTEAKVVITINPKKSIFSEEVYEGRYEEVQYADMMRGYISLHTRNGMIYKDGQKTKLPTTPVKNGDSYKVVAEEICSILNISYKSEGKSAKINGKAAKVSNENGKLWIDAKYFFEKILGKTVSIDTEAKSSGMMIAGDRAFSWPTGAYEVDNLYMSRTDLQNLNDYLFFERPTTETIQNMYNDSELKNVHPRVQATAEDFARIREDVKNNPQMAQWYRDLIIAADYLVTENRDAVTYAFSDGASLIQEAREVLGRMYALSMAYQLTLDQKYADRAWIDLYAVSCFPDWNAEEELPPVEMATGVAIAYDWMYDAFDEEQREIIEKAIYKHCFYDGVIAYQTHKGKMGGTAIVSQNHNIVVAGGLTVASIAFMDVYPEVSSYLISRAIRGADIMMTEFGPDGAWKEGPGYAGLTMQYTSKMLSSLETVFGTAFSLDECEGLSTMANYLLSMQSDQGIFNYGDGYQSNYYIPEIFYASNKYDDKGVAAAMIKASNGQMKDNEDVALSLLWYDTDIQEDSEIMPLDSAYPAEGASFRNAWTDGATTFVGIHGGKTMVVHAQVDAGTFVYDYAGIRWATELGITPYHTSVTAKYKVDGGRWLLYRSRAEAHNTIVINPDNSAGQEIDTAAKLTRFETKNRGGIAVLDLSQHYAKDASSATRGFFFTDDRTSLVVRDEISLTKSNSTVYWFMQTGAAVEIAEDGKSATLIKGRKKVTLEFVTSGTGTATLSVGPSIRMETSTSPITGGTTDQNSDKQDPNMNRIAIKLTGASGNVAITTKLTPVGAKMTSVEEYDKSIASWKVPEGEIAEKPKAQSIVIDGRELKFDSENTTTFLCVEGRYSSVPSPNVTVDESKYTYEVIDATTTDGGTTSVIVKDKKHENLYTIYTISMGEIPVAAVPNEERFDGMTALQVIYAEASAEPEANTKEYYAWKVLDQDLDSRWTSQGSGNWLLLELEEYADVDNLIILFKNGHLRSSYFNVSVSTDGVNYEQVYSGQSGGKAIGETEAYEQFTLGGKTVKYIRIDCNGNSVQGISTGWNNIGELVLTGTVVDYDPITDADLSTNSSGKPKDSSTQKDGDTNLLTRIALLVTGVAITLGVIYRKKIKGILLLLPVFMLLVGMGTNVLQIHAKEASPDVTKIMTTTNNVTLDGKTAGIGLNLTYKLWAGPEIYYEEDFEYEEDVPTYFVQWGNPSGVYVKSGTVSAVEDVTGNAALSVKVKKAAYQFNTRWSDAKAYSDDGAIRDLSNKQVVYEFELIPNDIKDLHVNLRSHNGGTKLSRICRVKDNVLMFEGVSHTIPLTRGKTYKIAVVNDYTSGIRDIYVNNSHIAMSNAINNWKNIKTSAMNDFIRFHYDSATTADFSIDNVRVYESNIPDWFKGKVIAPVVGIHKQPTSEEVCVGDGVILEVGANATMHANVEYQWYKCTDANKTNAKAIINANSAIYKITPQEEGITYYYCKVSAKNAVSIYSNVVSVTVDNSKLYREDFEYEGDTPDYLIEYGDTRGVYVKTGTVNAIKDASQNTKLNIKATNGSYQVNTRWSNNTRDLSNRKIVYEFELIPNGIENLHVNLRSENDGTKYSLICRIESNILSFAGVNYTIPLTKGKTYKIAVVNDYPSGKRDIYVNNECIAQGNEITNWKNIKTSTMSDFIRFHYDGATTVDFSLDNVRVYEADKPDGYTEPAIKIGTQPTAANASIGDTVTLTVAASTTNNAALTYQWYSSADGDKAGAVAISGATNATYTVKPTENGIVYYYCKVSADGEESVDSHIVAVTTESVFYEEDFEGTKATYSVTSGTVTKVTSGANTALNVTATNAAYRLNIWKDSGDRNLSGKKVVYEFDLIPNGIGKLNVNLRSSNPGTQYSTICSVNNNVLTFHKYAGSIALTNGKTYKIAVVNDYASGTRDIYVNNERLTQGTEITNWKNISAAAMTDHIRFHYDSATTVDFSLDNVRVYIGDKPDGYIGETPTQGITISTQPTAAEVSVGGKATLTVAASTTNNVTMTYQWYSCENADKAGTVAISGATKATYEVTPTEAGTKYYYCTVSAEGTESVNSNVVAVTATVDQIVYYEEDFEGTKKTYSVTSGTATKVTSGANTLLNVTSTDAQYRLNIWKDSGDRDLSGKKVVYEFDLIPNGIGKLNVNLRSSNPGTKYSQICTITNNVLTFHKYDGAITLTNGETYKIAVVNDYASGTRDIYVNNERLTQGTEITNWKNISTAAMTDHIRFHYDSATTANFSLDNIRVYEGDIPSALE